MALSKDCQIVILAAGQGKRMRPLTDDRPKVLLQAGTETVLTRLLRQLEERRFPLDRVSVVTGFAADRVNECLQSSGQGAVRVVPNPDYDRDTNILSLHLAVKDTAGPFIGIEGDSMFTGECVDAILDDSTGDRSVWYSAGPFLPHQLGGVLLFEEGETVDVQIIPAYDEAYSNYTKMIGLLRVGPEEADPYRDLLAEYVAKDTKQYYHRPWIDRLADLPAAGVDLPAVGVSCFNTPDAYAEALQQFGLR